MMNKPTFKDSPPLTDRVNAYDEAHLATISGCSTRPRKAPTGARSARSSSALM
jgi:hypothetical protein